MADIVFIKNFPNRAFAEQAKEILDRNSIACVLKSPDVSILGTASAVVVHGVDLYVEAQFQIKAYELLDAIYNGI